MSKANVPVKFLQLADLAGVPQSIASIFWTRVSNKKGYSDLVQQLMKANELTELEARKALTKLRTHYRDQQTEKVFSEMENRDFIQEAVEGFESTIGKLRKVKTPPKLKKKRSREIYVSDFHFPFVNEKALAQLMQEDADRIFILGDILDMYAASTHRTTIDHLTVRQELAMARVFLEELAKRFKEVNLISGNHDSRGVKRIQEFAPQLLPLIVHPFEILKKDLPNVNVLSTKVPGTAPATEFGEEVDMDYMAVDGDVMIGHFDNFMGKDAALKLADWTSKWSHILKIDTPKVIMQAHVHRLGMQYTPKGQLIMTTGCMCRPMPYQIQHHGKYDPPVNGYIVLERENGKTLIENTRMVNIEL